MAIQINELLSACLDLVQEANQTIIRGSEGELKVMRKFDGEAYTQVDVDVQTRIESTLMHMFPGIHIVGEEGQRYAEEAIKADTPRDLVPAAQLPDALRSVDLQRLIVWIDPVDGTSSYIKKMYAGVSCILGISIDGEACIGVVSLPFSENSPVYYGAVGMGLFVKFADNTSHQVTLQEHQGTKVISGVLRPNSAFTRFYDFLPFKDIEFAPGCGPKGIGVATGQWDLLVYPRNFLCLWDICGIAALVRVTGGVITTTAGEPLVFMPSEYNLLEGGAILGRSLDVVQAASAAWHQYKQAKRQPT